MTAEIFDTKVRKLLTNQAAPQVNAPIIVNCWLEEGNITVNAANTLEMKGRMQTQPTYSFATPLAKGDLVELCVSVYALYADLLGKPLVTAVSSSGGIIGQILDYPEPLQYRPANSTAANSVTKRVTGRYYRMAPVRIDALGYETVAVDGTAGGGTGGPILVGDRLDYDISAANYIKGTTSPLVSCHYAAAGSMYVGALRLPGIVTTQA
jgi:hypothetical protein